MKKLNLKTFLMILCLLTAQMGWADMVPTYYDFAGSINNGNTDVEVSSNTVRVDGVNCTYYSVIGNVADPGRFACQQKQVLGTSNNGQQKGLRIDGISTSAQRTFVVDKLYAGDIVTFNASETLELTANNNARANGNEFTIKEKGYLAVKIHGAAYIYSITIQHDDAGAYSFEPSIEIYKPTTGNLSLYDKKYPDFQLNNQSTAYLYNVNGISWNNRLAIPNGNLDGQERTNLSAWAMDGSGLKNNVNWVKLYLSVTDLEEGDRVRITYDDGNLNLGYNGIEFASNASSLNSEAFNDIDNNGELDETFGEKMLQRGDRLDKQVFYTITHDGHLDLCVYPQVRITKIEIYSDHRAQIECRDNGIVNGQYMGNTMYFTGTGQIKEKTFIMPGGLVVQFGNDNEVEHAQVSASIDGPAAYINDYQGFKPARNSSNSVENSVPETGTYYRFTPEVSGIMHLKFKAYNVRYTPTDVYWNNANLNLVDYEDPAPSGTSCPYYLKEANGNGGYSSNKWNSYGSQEATVNISNDIRVEAGKTYYLFGYWNGDFGQGAYCGVARLLEVTFIPDGFVKPLAKVIDNQSTSDSYLATVTGYSNPQVKKYLGNIVYAEPYVENNTLMIRNIQYKADSDQGGVVLIKFDNAEEPIFALTVAYDAGWNTKYGNSEGHTWDFSSKSLAIGRYADQNSTLYKEANEAIPDWTFAYRVGGDKNFDPMYLNAYDMEGDNADMIEETEGLWFETGSNQSCLYNEFAGDNIHVSEGADPDRYVGIMPGGSFTIPKLKQYDRVYIFMASGSGTGTNGIFLNITNALDAVGTPITSEYRAGGSLWNVRTESNGNHHNDPYYRGCYHFIAAEDGDMTFEMVGGSMCKIYQITIHRGDHYDTTEMNRNNNSGVGFFNEEGATTGAGGSYTIHYRGKGESIGAPEVLTWSGNLSAESFSSTYLIGDKNNVSFTSRVGDFGAFRMRLKDMDYTGNYVCDFCDRNFTVGYKEKVSYPCTWDFTDIMTYSGSDITAEAAIPDSESPVENKGWDLSLWDEESNMIVRHYDESVAVPDVDTYKNGFEVFSQNKNGQGNQFYANGKIIPETKGLWFYMDNNDAAYNGSMQITDDGLRLANTKKMQADGITNLTMGWWNYKMIVPDVPVGAAVYLRMTRDTSVGDGDYSQKPNEDPVYFLNTAYHFGASGDGQPAKTNLTPVSGSNFELSKQADVFNATGNRSSKYSFYKIDGSTDEWIVAVENTTGEVNDLTFTLNGWILKKMSVSTDDKTVNNWGWNTESRDHAIDPSLMSYMMGKDFRAYVVTEADVEKNTVTLVRIDGGSGVDAYDEIVNSNTVNPEKTIDKFYVPAAVVNPNANPVVPLNGSINACIVRYVDKNKAENDQQFGIFERTVVKNGQQETEKFFHLFVPDMHDKGEAEAVDLTGNLLKAQVTSTETEGAQTVPVNETVGDKNYNNYAFTSRHKNVVMNGQWMDGPQAFYRIMTGGAHSYGNQAYLSIEGPAPSRSAEPSESSVEVPNHYDIIFKDWKDLEAERGDVNGDGVVTQPDVELLKDYVTVRKSNGLFKRMGDMNDDGRVDIVDMTLLIQKIMGE